MASEKKYDITADPDHAPRISFREGVEVTPDDIDDAVNALDTALYAAGINERPIRFWFGQVGVFHKEMVLQHKDPSKR